MTTTVTIQNNGPHRLNINEVDRLPGDRERTNYSHTLAVGEKIDLPVWGANRYLCILETNDVDTPIDELLCKARETVKPIIEHEAKIEAAQPSNITLD